MLAMALWSARLTRFARDRPSHCGLRVRQAFGNSTGTDDSWAQFRIHGVARSSGTLKLAVEVSGGGAEVQVRLSHVVLAPVGAHVL